MASLFNKINRLKMQHDWSWEHFQFEIDSIDPKGIKLELLQRYHRSPNKKPTAHITEIIDLLHDEYFPSPFPEAAERLMNVYRELKWCRRHLTKDKDTRDLETHVKQQMTTLAADDYLSKACWQWLLGNIAFDRIAVYLEQGKRAEMEQTKKNAIEYYQWVIVTIEQHNMRHPQSAVCIGDLYHVHYNILACHLNAVPEAARNSDPEILKYVRESDYLARCKEAIAEEPFQWSIARNGLRFSSLLEDKKEIKQFFSLLVAVHPKFVDLSYEPFNQLSISVIPAYQWAIKNVLSPDYLAETSQQLETQIKDKQQKNMA